MIFTLGIDIGSTTSKCVILKDGEEIVGKSLVVAGTGTQGPLEAHSSAVADAHLTEGDIAYTVATGYGRMMYDGTDEELSELSCHALGTAYLFPAARTVIDIGGQDAKAMSLNDDGKMVNFVMNDKCAAGTGRFLDVMANILKLNIGDLEKQAALADKVIHISNTCTVFAESEVISQLSAGEKICNIVAGICDSVASRTAALARRIGIKEQVVMSGGVARNGGVRLAMGKVLGTEIRFSPLAQYTGALGASLFAYRKAHRS